MAEQKMTVLGKTRCFAWCCVVHRCSPRCRDAPEVMSDLASLGSAEVPVLAGELGSSEEQLLLSGKREQIFTTHGTGLLP